MYVLYYIVNFIIVLIRTILDKYVDLQCFLNVLAIVQLLSHVNTLVEGMNRLIQLYYASMLRIKSKQTKNLKFKK